MISRRDLAYSSMIWRNSAEGANLGGGSSLTPTRTILLSRIRLMQAGYRTQNGLRIRQAG
jgi:hypothetical protein